jgi:excinuclease UvrABC ATPase subunit
MYIQIKGAKENNLKNIDVQIPKNKFIVFIGLFRSGKSTLALETLQRENDVNEWLKRISGCISPEAYQIVS